MAWPSNRLKNVAVRAMGVAASVFVVMAVVIWFGEVHLIPEPDDGFDGWDVTRAAIIGACVALIYAVRTLQRTPDASKSR